MSTPEIVPTLDSVPAASNEDRPKRERLFPLLIYLNAFISGTVIMSFEMLGSRYLNPYFGSGIYTWAALIATVLIALMLGYFFGGWLADMRPSQRVLGTLIVLSAVYIGFVPLAADAVLGAIFDSVESVRTGSLAAALALLLVPLTLLGVYSPFAIRLTLRETRRAGRVAGRIYGVSTFGSVFGTLLTTFYLIPTLGSRSITYLLAAVTLACGLSFFMAKPASMTRIGRAGAAIILLALALYPAPGRAETIDIYEGYDSKSIRRALIESVESEYNNIFIYRVGDFTTMSFRVRYRDETESVLNRRDSGALPLPYTRAMTAVLAYADRLDSLLMIGLGGGTTSRYIAGHVPTLTVTVAELDGAVVRMAKKHFLLTESPRYRVVERDGRVHLMRNRKARYDIVMVDAFRGGYVPFHLLTREFYELLKQRLAPGGAAVFNVHGDTKLFESTMRTLGEVFGEVATVPAAGAVITIVRNGAPLSQAAALARADERQKRYDFRYDLGRIVSRRSEIDVDPGARILTDDFAPVNLYRKIRKSNEKRK